MHRHSPLMQSPLSRSQTPTAPRRVSRFFQVWLLLRLPCRADHSAYFGLTSFISSILSAVDADQTKDLLHRCQCKSPRKNEISVNGIVENAEVLCSYVSASSGRSVLARSRTGVATGQSAFQASGDVTFRYLMRTGIVASRSDS